MQPDLTSEALGIRELLPLYHAHNATCTARQDCDNFFPVLEKFFLRVLMLTVRFDVGVTFGELAAEPETGLA